MTDKINEKFKEDYNMQKFPLIDLGKPEDVANAVIFLCSDQSDYINGETLHVNGGMYLGWQNYCFNLIQRIIIKKDHYVRRYFK